MYKRSTVLFIVDIVDSEKNICISLEGFCDPNVTQNLPFDTQNICIWN